MRELRRRPALVARAEGRSPTSSSRSPRAASAGSPTSSSAPTTCTQHHHHWTHQDFGGKQAERGVARAHHHLLHRRPGRACRTATASASTRSRGSATTRTPTRPGRTRPRSWRRSLDGVPDDEINKITHENALRFFRARRRSRTARRRSAPWRALRAESPDVDLSVKSSHGGKPPIAERAAPGDDAGHHAAARQRSTRRRRSEASAALAVTGGGWRGTGFRKASRDCVARCCAWYDANARPWPWRRTRDPYRIWVSEVMLQQTRLKVVEPAYRRFVRAFPTLSRLARAGEDEVLSLWSGLGYYSRARSLHRAAQL